MKILFYDIINFELNYLLEKIPSLLEPHFIKTPLNSSVYIDDKLLQAEALSVFVSSLLDSSVLSKFKNLKYIFLRCVGYSNVDLEYCKENNIKVYNTPNYGNSTVAEYVFCLLLALSKKLIDSKVLLQKGIVNPDEIMGDEIFSKTMGVIGAGAIGRKVINIAHGFGMQTLVYDINQVGAYNFVSLDELLSKSDFISINCPLSTTSRNLINKNTISKMKKEAIIINTARGEIINTTDLFFALINRKIKGAALDVIECEEVLCNNWSKCNDNALLKSVCLKKYFFIQKLMQLPNVIITPHNAYNTKEAQERILKMTLENINSVFDINAGAKNLVLI